MTLQSNTKIIRSSAQLALYIKQRRKSLGLTQTSLASKAGITQQALSEFESDPSKSRIETALMILLALESEMQIIAEQKT
jgi:HTH-type transcriptional regulator/antitoxin HipB